MTIAGKTFITFDLGRHEQASQVWKNYLPAISGIVFLVDCADHPHLMETTLELNALMTNETIPMCQSLSWITKATEQV